MENKMATIFIRIHIALYEFSPLIPFKHFNLKSIRRHWRLIEIYFMQKKKKFN